MTIGEQSGTLGRTGDGEALRLSDVGRSFGATEAIARLNLSICRHEFVAVIGPSGCGKTTLLNLLSGFDRPTTGTVERQGQVRMIYQQGGLFPWLTVSENIALGLRGVKDAARRERTQAELLTLIGLEGFADHYPHQLSGGMQQRVELARALADETDILLMDEPFSALDYLTRLRMRRELTRILHERPRTVVFVTHDVEEAAQLADRILVLTPRPARIRCELRLDLPHPRSLTHPVVVEAVERLLHELGLDTDS
jgi:ABC-type nitrate/sulfonate/bicarbonate transport system ATPase subunit